MNITNIENWIHMLQWCVEKLTMLNKYRYYCCCWLTVQINATFFSREWVSKVNGVNFQRLTLSINSVRPQPQLKFRTDLEHLIFDVDLCRSLRGSPRGYYDTTPPRRQNHPSGICSWMGLRRLHRRRWLRYSTVCSRHDRTQSCGPWISVPGLGHHHDLFDYNLNSIRYNINT